MTNPYFCHVKIRKMQDLDVFLTASVAFIITFLAIPVVLQIADRKKLYDVPDERKLHTHHVSSLGGVGVFVGAMFALLLAVQGTVYPEFQYFFAAILVTFFLGLKDDLVALSATKKFIGQIMAAAIIIHLGGLRLNSMYGLFGINEIPETFSMALSYLTIIFIVNSYNLIDGIDGLAGSLGLLCCLVFGTYFLIIGDTGYALLAFAMSGSLVAFLIFNHHPAKIFMGDCGSLVLGLVCSILAIRFINIANTPSINISLPAAVPLAVSVIIVPLSDTIRVFATRILNGKSPFSPDRTHIHHLLLDRGLGHAAVTFILVSANVVLITLTYIFRSLGPTWTLAGLLTIVFGVVGTLYATRPRRRMVVAPKAMGEGAELQTRTSRVLSIASSLKDKLKIDQN